ncbi:MAG: hypothetical protein KZQ99_03735 [Candidatus Thiodiazotropha sp. (ex Dulcina madagascariensis)]|nr:hypothetical protein [Candidatus Thiodiazotropha sp. (ex Dulcina madagascariensis)]
MITRSRLKIIYSKSLFFFACLCFLFLVACGQKGPLYNPPVESSQPATKQDES